MADIELLLEAERRGILPPDKQALLAEARKRNLVPPAPDAAPTDPMKRRLQDMGIDPARAYAGGVAQTTKDIVGGAVRGAGSIGATASRPFETKEENVARRQAITEGLRSMGVDPESLAFQAGKIGAEIAGTAGVGGPLAGGARMLGPRAAAIVEPLQTFGLRGQNALARMFGGAVTGGAAAGLVDPTLESARIGAGFGAAVPAVFRGVGRLSDAASRLANPREKLLMEAAEGRQQQIINELRRNQVLVPGSFPTAGEAAVGAGATQFARLQQELANLPSARSAYFAREQAQEAARRQAVGQVARTEADLASAEAARQRTAGVNYPLAFSKIVKSDDTFRGLLGRPSIGKVIDRARNIAREYGDEFKFGEDVPEQRIPSSIIGPDGQPISETIIPQQVSEFPVKSLHYMKMAFDDLIKDPSLSGIGAQEARAISGTREQFIRWLENNVPEYKTAREAFAAQSVPINQMEIGQYLLRKIGSALDVERAVPYAEALREAPTTIKRAVGGPRYQDLEKILTPDQVKILEGVRDDLARGKLFKGMAKGPVDTATKGATPFTSAMIDVTGSAVMPSLLNRTAMIANTIFRRMQGKMDRKMSMDLAMTMLNPAQTADLLEQAARMEAKRGFGTLDPAAIRNQLMMMGAAAPSVVSANALAEQ